MMDDGLLYRKTERQQLTEAACLLYLLLRLPLPASWRRGLRQCFHSAVQARHHPLRMPYPHA